MNNEKTKGRIEERGCWISALAEMEMKNKIKNELFDEIIDRVTELYKEINK